MEIHESKIGTMFNIKTPWNVNDKNASMWVRADDIIGVCSWTEKDYSYDGSKVCYAIRVNFICGKGLNGVDSTIQVTKDIYNEVAKYLELPTMK